MKKGIVVLLAVILMAGVASAQIQFGVGGGISKAMGDGSEYWKLGFNGRVTAFMPQSDNLHIGVMGAYNSIGMDIDAIIDDWGVDGMEGETDVKMSIIEIIGAVKYFMTPQFYLQAGGGLYMMKAKGDYSISGFGEEEERSMDESESKPGISLGAGFNMGSIGIAAFYNMVFTEDESTKYFTVNAMIGLN